MITVQSVAAVLVVACLSGLCDARAKGIGRVRVRGPGFSVRANSARHCLALCNKQPACDAANYHSPTSKCRIFTRCAPTVVIENSLRHYYFSKRPQIKDNGYSYDEKSDSCLKLIEQVADYANADVICRNQGGRLASLVEPSINSHATSLLRSSKVQFAWIGLTDSMTEGDPMHSNGERVSETGFFPRTTQGHRNDTARNCWSLSDTGEWTEHSCKNREQYSLCQIISY